MSRIKRTSPALVISILALIAALVVPALAQVATTALTKKEKRVVRKIARGQANKQITKRAGGLSVANAANANALSGIGPDGFLQVGTRARQATDNTDDTNYPNDANLLQLNNLQGGQWVIWAVVELQNDSPPENTINCDLVHNATQVDTRSVRLGIEDEADTGVNTLMALRTMSAGSDDVFIRCDQNFAGTADAKHMRIIAMKVNN